MSLLKGKFAVVTGAASARGLGKATAKLFTEHGATVAILDLDAEAARSAAADLGADHVGLACNVTDKAACDAAIAELLKRWGRVDILVNNAGMSPRMPSHEVSEKLFDSVLGLNFKGPFRLSSLVGKRMFDRAEAGGAGGCIINVTSSGSMMPLPQVVPYGSSKAALNAMSRSLAWEYAPHVRVNTLSPGAFRTDIVEAWPDKGQGPIPIPRGHAANPEEIITAALFLASPASVNVTGSLVRCDGGQH